MLVCEAHYEGKKHNSKVAQELEKFRQVKRKEFQHHLVSKFTSNLIFIDQHQYPLVSPTQSRQTPASQCRRGRRQEDQLQRSPTTLRASWQSWPVPWTCPWPPGLSLDFSTYVITVYMTWQRMWIRVVFGNKYLTSFLYVCFGIILIYPIY